MALTVGAVLAIAVSLLARLSGLDRDRAFYPTVAIVVASYYALFAVMGASTHTLVGGHGVFDFFHGSLISNPGVPVWWPAFCLMYDVTAAACLAWLLRSGRLRNR